MSLRSSLRPARGAIRQLAAIAALASLPACATYKLNLDRCPAYPPASATAPPDSNAGVRIQYLGTGGYLISRGEDAVLFGPVYSNPSMAEVVTDQAIRSDNNLIERLLPAVADKAKAIIIGHSHFDHAMDTPYIASHRAKGATIYGSQTAAHLLSAFPELGGKTIVPLDEVARKPGNVMIGPRMRLWPILSEHSGQLRIKAGSDVDMPFHMWRGDIFSKPDKPPRSASDWAEGTVLAYLLDFLDDSGAIVFRIYYQDSGTDFGKGFPEEKRISGLTPDQRKVDVSLICLGGDFEHLDRHPEGIIGWTKPRFAILGHWEDFFMPQPEFCRRCGVTGLLPQHLALRSDTSKFLSRANAAAKAAGMRTRPILPCPTTSVFTFPLERNDVEDARIGKAIRRSPVSFDCALMQAPKCPTCSRP